MTVKQTKTNPVAKFMNDFNRPNTHADRRERLERKAKKHRNRYFFGDYNG